MASSNKQNYDVVWLVTISAALVTVVRYSAAFISSDMGQITGQLSEVITILMGFTGLGMGILDVFGGAYLFNGWRKTMPRSGQKWSPRFKVLTFFVMGLITSGMTILVPFTISRISQVSVAEVLGKGIGEWVWATMVNVVPYFLVGGVFAGNRIIMDLESSESNSETTSRSRPTSENTSRSYGTGRPSIHEAKVFAYLDSVSAKEKRVASFTEVATALKLPQSTASRLRNKWIENRR